MDHGRGGVCDHSRPHHSRHCSVVQREEDQEVQVAAGRGSVAGRRDLGTAQSEELQRHVDIW